MDFMVIGLIAFSLFLFALLLFLASCYKRCPSNKVLAIYGKVGEGQSVRCTHGGGAFVWPLRQSDVCKNRP